MKIGVEYGGDSWKKKETEQIYTVCVCVCVCVCVSIYNTVHAVRKMQYPAKVTGRTGGGLAAILISLVPIILHTKRRQRIDASRTIRSGLLLLTPSQSATCCLSAINPGDYNTLWFDTLVGLVQ